MPYKDTTATAWGEEKIYIADAKEDGAMPNASEFKLLGNIKEDSISIDTQEGKKYEWKATGGRVVDSYQGEPTHSVKCVVKNLNKSVLEKVWKVKEVGNALHIESFSMNKKYAIKMDSEVEGAEVVKFAKCAVSAKQIYSGDNGFELEVTFSILDPGEGKPKQVIENKA